VNEYHDSLSNAKLVKTLSYQLEHLRSDLSAMKSDSTYGPPKTYSYAGKKDYKVRSWYDHTAAQQQQQQEEKEAFFATAAASSEPQVQEMNSRYVTIPPANGLEIPPPPANGFVRTSSTNDGLDTTSAAAAEASINSSSSLTAADFRAELQAVSAELQKVARENEALQKIHLQHAEREQDLQIRVCEQLEAYGKAERELEQVKAQSLQQLEKTNQEAADRLAQETAEFKDRLLQAEHMVRRMAEILIEAESKLEEKFLLDDHSTPRDFVAEGVNHHNGAVSQEAKNHHNNGAVSPSASTQQPEQPANDGVTARAAARVNGFRWDKVKNTWGKVRDTTSKVKSAVRSRLAIGEGGATVVPEESAAAALEQEAPATTTTATAVKYQYEQQAPAAVPQYEISRVERVSNVNLDKLRP